jgi:fructose 5-dehydrogenase small subunit
MEHSSRDDAPSRFLLSRRQLLIGGGFLLSGLALGLSAPLLAIPAEQSPFGERFMTLSGLLIDHKLNNEIGVRLAAAMKKGNPDLPTLTDELIAIAHQKNAKVVEDFFPDIPAGPLKEVALAIISAWYKGVLVDAPGAEVFAYEQALMYQPSIDVMTIPTYAISGPNAWGPDAPPLSDMPNF